MPKLRGLRGTSLPKRVISPTSGVDRGLDLRSNQVRSAVRHSWVSFHSCTNSAPSLAGLLFSRAPLVSMLRTSVPSALGVILRRGRQR